MLPFKIKVPSQKVIIVNNFVDNNTKTIYGLTYDELLQQFGSEWLEKVSEYEYNNNTQGFCPYGIYGNCYYRYYAAHTHFTSFGCRVLEYTIMNKKALSN